MTRAWNFTRGLLLHGLNLAARRHMLHIERVGDMLTRAGRRDQ